MKRVPAWWSTLALFLPLALFPAQADSEASVKTAELAWSSAIIKNDLVALDRLLADDLIYYHSSGKIDTKKSYIESLQSAKMKYVLVDYEQMKIRLLGTSSVVNAKLRIKANDNGRPIDDFFLLTHVYVKQKGTWQMISHQTTKLP